MEVFHPVNKNGAYEKEHIFPHILYIEKVTPYLFKINMRYVIFDDEFTSNNTGKEGFKIFKL